MDQTPPKAQPPEAVSQESTLHRDGGPSDTPINALPLPSSDNVEDNPRSPKRRRISLDDDQQDTRAEAERPRSQISTAPAGQPLVTDNQAQNGQTKPPPEKQAQSDGKPTPEIGQPQVALIAPPTGQAHSIATKPQQQPTPPRTNPLENLPSLDHQASLILTFLSRLTPAEALGLSTNPGAPSSREYASLRAAFDRTRRLLSPGWPFLPQHDLGLRDSSQLEIIRRANQAIFMSSIFTGEIGLRDMDRSFLAVFVPENGSLIPAQGSMYLELKTQGFITAWRTGAAPPDLVMRDMFGPDLDKMLLARRPGTTTLTDIERDFLRMLNSRRGILESAVKTKTLDQLPVSYKWEDFSREVSSYLITYIVRTSSDVAGAKGENDGVQIQDRPSVHGAPLGDTPVKEDFVALAARAAEVALRTTLGLSLSERIPDLPSSSASAPAPIPVVRRITPVPQPSEEDSRPSGGTTLQRPPSSEQMATEPTPEQNMNKDIPHASQTALTKLDGEISLEREEQQEVSKAISVSKEESGGGQVTLPDEANKPVQPSKPEVEAITPPAVTDSRSESPGLRGL